MQDAGSPKKDLRVDVTGPIDVDLGTSIAHVSIGMGRQDVLGMKIPLVPEGVERVDQKGYKAGPLLVLFDSADRVAVVSVELRASKGLRVAGQLVPRDATLDQIAKILGNCTRSQGSGGEVLDCRGPNGRVTHFYTSFADKSLTVVLSP
jgi:hypothetical protein